jgi:hypothetical protein
MLDTELLIKFGTLVASAATAYSVAAGSEFFKKHFSKPTPTPPPPPTILLEPQIQDCPRSFAAKQQVLRRIEDARSIQAKRQGSATASTWSARSLTFGQYVVGGVLASSFVQTKISPPLIGALGVLVLLASLITQHYHPEVSAQVASQKAEQLESLIRESEDRVVVIETTADPKQDDPKPLLGLLENISAQLRTITAVSTNPVAANYE